MERLYAEEAGMKKILGALLTFLSASVFAADRFGAWEVLIDESDIQIAKTSNADGAVSGVMCFRSSNSCVTYFVTNRTCEEKSKYPILINSTVGALASNATCIKMDGRYLMALDNFDDVVKAFEGGGEIGFALPLDGGQFSVSRFDCSGATPAIRKARAISTKSPAGKNPASQVL